MPKLLLVRHGNTRLNSAARFWGQTDVELSAEGIAQAEKLRDRLASQKIDTVYASNLSRAVATARIIATRHKVKIVTREELGEIDFGEVEGLAFDEINERYPELAESMANWSIHPGFPGGETIDQLDERVNEFLPQLKKHTEAETILIVAHSGILRLMICNLLAIGKKHWRQLRIDLASLSIIDTYPRGAILSLLNDISHLS
jgi:alpha-ribazole phosphatase